MPASISKRPRRRRGSAAESTVVVWAAARLTTTLVVSTLQKRQRRLAARRRPLDQRDGPAVGAEAVFLEQSALPGGHLAAMPEVVSPHPRPRPLAVPGEAPLEQWRRPVGLPSLGSRLAAWTLRHATDLTLIALVVTATGVIHAWGMTRSPGPFDDEGTYVAQAWAVQHLGALAPYTYWYDHPPLGWLLLALATWPLQLFNASSHAVMVGRDVILVAQLVSSALVYGLARRMAFSRACAVLAVALFSLSPLGLHYQRMVFLDNLAMPFLLAAFVFALTPRHRLWAYAASGACIALAALVKETMLLFLPALCLVVWQNSDRHTRRYTVTVFAAVLVLVGGFYPLFALLRGELLAGPGHTSLESGVLFQLAGRADSGSVFDAHSGSHQLIVTWFSLDRVLPLAALALMPVGLLISRLRPAAAALAIPVAMILRPDGYVPAMFILGLLPFAALLVAGLPDLLWKAARRPHSHDQRLRVAGHWAARLAALCAVAGLAWQAGPAWTHRDREMMTTDQSSAYWKAETWITKHVSQHARLLVDDTLWTDLVDRGFAPQTTVWFYKLDLDPAIRHRFPAGWRDFEYIIATNLIHGVAGTGQVPQTAEAINHSQTVQTFTTGDEQVQIRRIIHP